MKYKPDWDEAAARLTALWEGKKLDRPCLSVTAPSGKQIDRPEEPENPEDRWLDPDWVISNLTASIENTWWGGESVPSYLLMGGWIASLGGTPRFSQSTIWFETFEVDFGKTSPFVHTPDDPWRAKFEALYRAVAKKAGRDDFQVGKPALLPANDLLSMHMGTTTFLTALADEPEWIRSAIITGAKEQLAERIRLTDAIRDTHDFWYGHAGWMPFWAPEPYASTQSDVSCMLSPEMFEEFIVPELDIYGNAFGSMWYHLDGQDAKQHLPRLLSLPYMRVIQYVPTPAEPPNGMGHLDLYREIQAAGKIVHVQTSKQEVEPLYKALDPRLTILDVRCDTVDEGKSLLAAASKWM
jgi:hypothetical protein